MLLNCIQPFIKLLCCLAIICLFSRTSIAQNQTEKKYRAVHWGLDEGLSQGETYHIIKDVNGFLWIGTRYGLNRFDGNTFKVFTHQRNNNKSLISNSVINGLIEDSLHNIWVGSEDRGVSRYNIKTEDFTNFFADSTNWTITPFWATKNEVLCVERDYITAYNIHTSAKKILANLHGFENNSIGPSFTYTVFDNNTNTVWCLILNSERKAALLEINLATNEKKFYILPHYSKSDYWEAEAMCYDATRKCIWINGNEGLLRFTLSDKQFHHINALSEYEHLKDYSRFVGITLDKQGRVWFATHPEGMIIYNPDDESVSLPFPSDSLSQQECSIANACVYCDRDNIIWSGSWLRKGIYGILPFSPVVKHYTPSPKKDSLNSSTVADAVDGGNNKLWLSTYGGINILDIKTGTFKALQQKDLPGIQMNEHFIGVIKIDTVAQKAWLATDGGFFKMDVITHNCIPILFKKLNNEITSSGGVPKFNGKEIFFAGDDDKNQSVYILNLSDDTAYQIISFTGHSFNTFYTVLTGNNFLFLQGNTDEKENQTYAYKSGKWFRTYTPIDTIRWASIRYVREDNSYWVAGENQLFHFDKKFHLIKTYSKDNGLTELPVVGLINDNNGNIWFHTDRSIQEMNTETGQIITMAEKDGFEKQDFTLMPFASKDKNGNVYYGGGPLGTGLTKINPNNFSSTVSSVYLTSLSINQNPFPLKNGINYTDTLSLKYDQTRIEIETGIIDFYSQGKSRIRYKLKSNKASEGWQYAPYYYTIRYEGLQPGNYKLVMQASNASNEFNGPEKKLFIHISSPFWQTWWFRILVVVVAVAVIYAFIQYRLRNLKKRNVILEEKVMHRTKELKHSLEDLKATQTQLIQAEKMASLGELTSGIAHEIKNPLNFINNFSEINIELIKEIEEEQLPNIDENIRTEITPVIKTLKKNAEKINHHGNRIDSIVKGMLQHSRLGNVKKEFININELSDESLKLAYNGFRSKERAFSASFETHFEPELPKLMIIPQDVGRVLINLINNAFYTVNEKKKRSQLTLLPQTDSTYKPCVIVSTKKFEDKIIITVSDNGMGISSQIISKIFQPFFTTKPTGEGTGLGLSMSYDIITKGHGGELRAKSQEGEGTDFEIVLPVS